MNQGSRARFLHLHPSMQRGPSREDMAGQLSPASQSGTSLLLSPPDVWIRRPWNSHLHSWAAALPGARWTLELSAEATGTEPGRGGTHVYRSWLSDPQPLLCGCLLSRQCPPSPSLSPNSLHLHLSCLLWQPGLDGECPSLPPCWHCPSGVHLYPPPLSNLTPVGPVLLGNLTAIMQATGNM